jgi:hypothetical protein
MFLFTKGGAGNISILLVNWVTMLPMFVVDSVA